MVFHFVILSVLRVLFNKYSYVNVSLKHKPSNAPTFLGHEKVFDVKTNIFQVYFLFWLIFHIVAFYSPVIFRWNLIRIQILTKYYNPKSALSSGERERVEMTVTMLLFRLFACMNPATDTGKHDLPPGLRNRSRYCSSSQSSGSTS